MEYRIRVANEIDLKGLCEIRNNKDLFIRYLKQQDDKEIFLVIAEKDHVVLGFGVLKLIGSLHPKLSDLYVKETYRGRGIGSDLIRYREKMASDKGFSELFVSVDPIENSKMIKLITKLGYKAISEPYIKSAIYYKDDGTTYKKAYSRIDLKKSLN